MPLVSTRVAGPAAVTPLLRTVARPIRILLGTVLVLLTAGCALYAAYSGLGRGTLDGFMNGPLYNGVLIAAVLVCATRAALVATDRAMWALLSGGMLLWTVASAGWTTMYGDLATPPFPTWADVLWLLWYPATYTALMLYVRARARVFHTSIWLDGLIGALTVAAYGTVVVVSPVAATAGGGLAATATNIAYPLGDLLLLSFTIGVFALSGWRPGREWLAIGGGFTVLSIADAIYAIRVATGTYHAGTLLDALWPIGMLLLAVAAWQTPVPRERPMRLDGWRIVVIPFVFMAGALALLVIGGMNDLSPVAMAVSGLALAAGLIRMVFIFREVQTLADTRREALTDELTGLPNRRMFYRRAEQMITETAGRGDRLAVLLIDLDRFKEVNDTLGHHAGDLLLEQVGHRLRSVLRDGDLLARLGGDEFAVVTEAGSAQTVAQRVVDLLREPFEVREIRMQTGASVGVAFFPDHGNDAETLLQRADVAMYEAKNERRGPVLYEADRDRHSVDRLSLVGELHDAIENDELILHYQPKTMVGTGDIIGVEALVRWQHPERGLLPPAEFLPLAEQTGAMRALTVWVLRAALRQCAEWRERGVEIPVAVNVSATNLLDEQIVEIVLGLLGDAGVPPRLLVLELTEHVVMADPHRARDVLATLRATGIGIALDDFGTGYSSLAYLKELAIDELKIDRSFVRDIARNHDDAAIVRSTIDLAHSLKLRVVGEGVEDADALAQLNEYGAEIAQGYFLSYPLPADELIRLIESAGPATVRPAAPGTAVPA